MRPAEGGPRIDRGREAVYAAEEAAFGGTDVDSVRSLSQLIELADTVTTGEWWHSCEAPSVVVVAARADAGCSSAGASVRRTVVIRLSVAQLTVATLAHELAHALAGVGRGHDDSFRAAHVDVIALLAGRDLANALERCYVDHRVPAGRRAWPVPNRIVGAGFVIVP